MKPQKKPPPKGQYHSLYGGYEKTQLAMCPLGVLPITDIKRDHSPAAKRKRTRERLALNARCEAFEREVAALLDAEEARLTKEFHNGG